MPHVLVAGAIHPRGLAMLEQAEGFSFDYVPHDDEASYARLIGRADALIVRTQPLRAETIGRAPLLKIVSRHGVGYDAVDVAALNARNIPLTIVGDVTSRSVAEHAMMLMLACAHKLPQQDRAVREGQWAYRNSLQFGELYGKTLLIIGFGRIGQHLGHMADAFGMRVVPFGRASGDLQAALAGADFVSIHTAKAAKPVLGAAEIACLKPSAILINTARGGVVDEAALVAALQEGRLAGAGLDVFDAEPPAPGHPLLALDQVVLSPHSAAMTREGAERMAVASVQNVFDFVAGKLNHALVVNGA